MIAPPLHSSRTAGCVRYFELPPMVAGVRAQNARTPFPEAFGKGAK